MGSTSSGSPRPSHNSAGRPNRSPSDANPRPIHSDASHHASPIRGANPIHDASRRANRHATKRTERPR